MDYIFEKGKFKESELESAIISLFDQYEYAVGQPDNRKGVSG